MPLKKRYGQWVMTQDELPPADGDYMCSVSNGDRKFEAQRRFIRGHWFGGCRPFSDNDVVESWYRHTLENILRNHKHEVDPFFDFAFRLGLTIEALIEREVDLDLMLQVMEDRQTLNGLIHREVTNDIREAVDTFLEIDEMHYQIMLTEPCKVVKQHIGQANNLSTQHCAIR